MASRVRDRPVVLVGMMGAGKSTLGPALAARLNRPFIDLDDAIEARAGATIGDLFEHRGEDEFRQLEARELAAALHAPPAVIAAGGGAVLTAENRERMREEAVVVWLMAPLEVLVERVGDGAARPLLAEDPVRRLADIFAARCDIYEAVADVAIAAIGPVEGAVDEVERAIDALVGEATG